MEIEISRLTNIDRIAQEIERNAKAIAPEYGIAPSEAVLLLMKIVDMEDQNSVTPVHGINMRIKGMIQDAARNSQPSRDR